MTTKRREWDVRRHVSGFDIRIPMKRISLPPRIKERDKKLPLALNELS
jgi:hypothetical protein